MRTQGAEARGMVPTAVSSGRRVGQELGNRNRSQPEVTYEYLVFVRLRSEVRSAFFVVRNLLRASV